MVLWLTLCVLTSKRQNKLGQYPQMSHPDPLDHVPHASPDTKRLSSPQRLFLVLIGTIFSAELLVMTTLHFLAIPPLLEIFIDSSVLVLLLMPVLLKAVVYPMQSKIEALAEAQQSLQTAAAQLEHRVQERTEALTLSNETLQQEIKVRIQVQEELQQLAATDTLTGLRNRRAVSAFTEMEIKRAERYGEALSLVMFDIDQFKRINDTYGHLVGDEVLIHVAKLIGERIRASEILARWGGEEFILVLPQTDMENAVHLAGELRTLMQKHAFPQVGTVTASFGVTQYSRGDSMDSLLHRADIALYRAKESGRNRVAGEAFTPLS